MKRVNKRLCACVVLCVGTNALHAQHSVTLSTAVEHIENPNLSNVSPGSVTVLIVAPSYVFEAQDERVRSRFSAGVVVERSSNTDRLANREYPNLGYTWAYSWPTSSLELRASLAESATRNSELREFGRVTIDTKERTMLAGAVWDQEMTARTRLALSVDNTRVSYDSAMFEGYRELGMASRFSWEATERTTYFFEPSYARLTFADAGAVVSQSRWLAGARSALTPAWSLSASAGQAQTSGVQKFTGMLGRLQLSFAGSRLTSDIEWLKDVTASGTTSAYVATEAVGVRLGYRVTEATTVLANLTHSESGGITGGRGSVFSLSVENELGSRWTSTLGFQDRKSRDLIGNSGSGWAVRAGLSYAFPGR